MRGLDKLFKAVGAPTTCLVVTSGHSEKRGSFLSQKANWISSCKQNMETIKNAGNGSVFEEISKGVFKELDIIIPPKEQMNDFDVQVNSYFQKIKSNSIQARTLVRLRDTLLPKLMSGEVRVKLGEEEACI
ncbi:MAG: hypothetical protein Q7U60_01660 [Candidatus Methanoperedens sp.]|nr:hypothetical protein [Candidatus Methanoperedens sp.]